MHPPYEESAREPFHTMKVNTKARKGTPTPLPDRSAGSYLLPMTHLRRTAALLALPLLLAACGTNEPAPDAGPGRLIFTRVGNHLMDIYAMDVNGRNLEQLTTSFAFEDWGAWSPDTFKILFQSNRTADSTAAVHYHIYVMNSDGSNVSQLTFEDSADSYHPAWSPNGTKIAFGSNRDGNGEIYVMDPNGSNIVRLTTNAAEDGQPAWSPDGTKIAFQSDRQTDFAVWVMNADGSNPTRLTDPSTQAGAPGWSPDSTRIAYEQGGDLWVMNVDGSRKIRITSGFWIDGLPRWRPIL